MTKFADWPSWLQAAVPVPHGIPGYVAFWLGWPKTKTQRKKFGFVVVYLFAVYLVLRYVFALR